MFKLVPYFIVLLVSLYIIIIILYSYVPLIPREGLWAVYIQFEYSQYIKLQIHTDTFFT